MHHIRITGPDMDISIALLCDEDFAMLELLLTKLRKTMRGPQASVETKTEHAWYGGEVDQDLVRDVVELKKEGKL
jgi:hypothetical protein